MGRGKKNTRRPAKRRKGSSELVADLSARVIRCEGPEFVVAPLDDQAREVQCVLRGRQMRVRPVVGDIVDVATTTEDGSRSTIVAVAARTNLIERAAPMGRGTKALVANLDQLVVVAAAHNPPLRPGLIDRYIVCAESQGILPVVCINKWDLASAADDSLPPADVLALYEGLGYPTVKTSCETEDGLGALEEILSGRTSAFVGHSGVGKSRLLKSLFPHRDIAVGAVSEATGRGRHTTTHASLLHLPKGGFVIDTPGIREFGLVRLQATELGRYFCEFADQPPCRFYSCTHTHEPACAIKEAAESGDVSGLRLDSYRKLFQELREGEQARF